MHFIRHFYSSFFFTVSSPRSRTGQNVSLSFSRHGSYVNETKCCDKQQNEHLSNLNSFPLQTAPFLFARFVVFLFIRIAIICGCAPENAVNMAFFFQPIHSDLREHLIFFSFSIVPCVHIINAIFCVQLSLVTQHTIYIFGFFFSFWFTYFIKKILSLL